MGDNNVKFYSSQDMSCGYYLKEAEQIIDLFSIDKTDYKINEILELYNIKLFFNADIRLHEWDDLRYNSLADTVKKFDKPIGIFFSKINNENFDSIYNQVNYVYRQDFWELFDSFKLYNRIHCKTIASMLESQEISIKYLLSHKSISKKYEAEIRSYMLENPQTAEILMSNYLTETKHKYFFPDILMPNEREKIIIDYIESNACNPNYLQLIINSNPSKELSFRDKTKLKAKKRYEQKIKELFDDNTGYNYGVDITFLSSQQEEISAEKSNGILHFSYDTSWIKSNLDYPTLLNNFIYLFGITDLQFRCQWCHKQSQLGVFESHLGIRGKNEYFKGIQFEIMNMKSLAEVIGYSDELFRNDIELEKGIEWFFIEYLKDEFDVTDYTFSIPSKQVSYAERCKLMVIELERVLKQFKLYVEEGAIDKELLQISSKQVKYEYVPSMIKNKYLYPIKKECQVLMQLLFSNQSCVCYTEKFGSKYGTFYELIKNESVFKLDFFEHQIPSIEYLIEKNMLNCGKDEQLTLNTERTSLLKDLYYNEVSRTDYVSRYLDSFDEQEQNEMFTFGESLFSKPEQEYLNYMLNNSEFSNGLSLRNNYLHGTNSTDEEINRQDYYQILKIIIFTIIKINEEFCFVDDLKKKQLQKKEDDENV